MSDLAMSELLAYLAICFVAGVFTGARSGFGVGICVAAAWILGRAHG